MELFETYKQWMEVGVMGRKSFLGGGLCNEMPARYWSDFNLFKPTKDDFSKMDKNEEAFWAYGLKFKKNYEYNDVAFAFTPLRQTIALFICAMNDEL